MSISPNLIHDKQKSRAREIDLVTKEVDGWWGRRFVSIRRMRVNTWKGALLLSFVGGVIAGCVWIVSLGGEPESYAKVERVEPEKTLQEVMRLRGCIADGLLSGYGGDTQSSIDLINRSECVYLHRALESWLNPPDFELARRIQGHITRPVVYGMFLSEALNTEAEYYSSTENRVLRFSDMCEPGSQGFWGERTCKASLNTQEYKAYVNDITRKAMDMGIQSFLFGQISFQDPKGTQAREVLEEMRLYAAQKDQEIAIGAQTNTITDKDYLGLFDYIEGGVGVSAEGEVEEKPCASRYEKAGWCWALLWHRKYATRANMVLLHLDWSGIEGDDMAVFARMDAETRARTLTLLQKKFNTEQGKTGFLFPFLATLYEKNDGCYGAKKSFYSPDNRYSCKDEDVMNSLLRLTSLPENFAKKAASFSPAPLPLPQKEAGSIAESGKREEKNNAEFDGQDVPDTMIAGKSYTVSVSMKNTGTTEWSDKEGYRLGSQNPQDNTTWGGRVFLDPNKTTEPKETRTFTFSVTAPEKPGRYEFEWRMLREGEAWFGESSRNKTITVEERQEEPIPSMTHSLPSPPPSSS